MVELNLDELKAKYEAELAEAKAQLTEMADELEKSAKGFVKKNRYYFIAGAFVVGCIVGLIF